MGRRRRSVVVACAALGGHALVLPPGDGPTRGDWSARTLAPSERRFREISRRLGETPDAPRHKATIVVARATRDNASEEADDGERAIESVASRRIIPRPPAGSRVRIEETDAGTLRVAIPGRGPRGDDVLPLTFAAAWFGIVGTWTAAALAASPLFAAFSLPFWVAGGKLASDTVVAPATSTALSIGQFSWELTTSVFGREVSRAGGEASDLRCAEVVTEAYVNGVPVTSLRLREGVNEHVVAAGLAEVEERWLEDVVNAHLREMRRRGTDWSLLESPPPVAALRAPPTSNKVDPQDARGSSSSSLESSASGGDEAPVDDSRPGSSSSSS